MIDADLVRLQRALAAHRRSRSLRYPPTLRAQVAAYAAERRRRGAWWCDIARPLGVPVATLVRWATPAPDVALPMRPVEVVDQAVARTVVTLVAPSGIRIEGIDVATAIAILRGLA
jgi:hypothetical protein